MIFAKFRNSLVGASDAIVLPDFSDQFDYEAELAVVIGRPGRRIAEDEAWEHVAGVTAFNDATARKLQKLISQWTLGKAVDTFAPCGPVLVTLDEIGSIDNLPIKARVNGRTVQESTTGQMAFTVPQLIAHLSRGMTLETGDLIATGTPAGVGVTREPQVLLQPGDRVEIEIDGVGTLNNPVVGSGALTGSVGAEHAPATV